MSTRLPILRRAAFAALFATSVSLGDTLVTFDADLATAGPQNGSGSILTATGAGTDTWWNNATSVNVTWASTTADRWDAVFGGPGTTGSPGLVNTLRDQSTVSLRNVTVNGDLWTIGNTDTTRGTINLTGAFTVNGVNPVSVSRTTLNFLLAGTGGLTVNGGFVTSTFRGNLSTFTGPTTLNGGVLNTVNLSNAGGTTTSLLGIPATPAAGGLVLNGGTLRVAATYGTADTGGTTNRLFTLGAAGGTLDANSINTAGTATTSGGTVKFTNTGAIATVGTGSRTLTLTGANTTRVHVLTPSILDGDGGSTSLIKSGSATWTLGGSNTYTGPTTITAGTLRVTPPASAPLLTGGGASLTAGTLVFDYTGGSTLVADVRGALLAGKITSPAATATRGLGYADDGAGTVTVKLALFGDADFDGGVSINDFNALAGNFGQASGKLWADGDFDYDGGVSINDFNLLAGGFGQSLPAGSDAWAGLLAFATAHNDLAAFEAVTGVPEPTGVAAAMAAMTLAVRRRRRCP